MSSRTKVDLNVFDRARTFMVLDHPWWGSLALRLKIEPTEAVGTAATDGVTLLYSPKFFEALTAGRRLTVIAHEVYHCANGHMTRRGARDPELWNMAADHVANNELKKNGFEPIDGFNYEGRPFQWLCDPQFDGMAVEQVYAILEKDRMQQQQGPGGGKPGGPPQKGKGGGKSLPGPGQCWDFGHINDAPLANEEQPLSPQQLEEDWKIAVQEATEVARKAGTLPAGLARMADKLKQSRTDWREVLRRWISVVGDFSWTRPNRRFIGRGIYIPGTVKTRLNCLLFAVDTSGSISDKLLALAAAELEAIFETELRPADLRAIYCDAKVQKVDDLAEEIVFRPKGGGGTCFQPVFDWVEEQGIEPDVLIYFTDTEASDLNKLEAPSYPVVWLIPEQYADRKMPFGETAVITEF